VTLTLEHTWDGRAVDMIDAAKRRPPNWQSNSDKKGLGRCPLGQIGSFRWRATAANVSFWSEADIEAHRPDVRFNPKSGHSSARS